MQMQMLEGEVRVALTLLILHLGKLKSMKWSMMLKSDELKLQSLESMKHMQEKINTTVDA